MQLWNHCCSAVVRQSAVVVFCHSPLDIFPRTFPLNICHLFFYLWQLTAMHKHAFASSCRPALINAFVPRICMEWKKTCLCGWQWDHLQHISAWPGHRMPNLNQFESLYCANCERHYYLNAFWWCPECNWLFDTKERVLLTVNFHSTWSDVRSDVPQGS